MAAALRLSAVCAVCFAIPLLFQWRSAYFPASVPAMLSAVDSHVSRLRTREDLSGAAALPAAHARPTASPLGLPACRAGVPTIGRWVDSGSKFADVDPPCCSWDPGPGGINNGAGYKAPRSAALTSSSRALSAPSDARPVCSMDTIYGPLYNGAQHGQSFFGRDALLMPSGGLGCRCGVVRAAVIQRFEWTPDSCSLPAWDSGAFCRALGNRTVLWIGDSTGGQLSAAVHNYVAWGGGGCAHHFVHEPSDTLTGKNYGVMNRGKRWIEYVGELAAKGARPDIVILGAGPHIASIRGRAPAATLSGNSSDADSVIVGTPAFIEVLETTWKDFKDSGWGEGDHPLRLVWRTSLGAGCLVSGDALVPLPKPPRDTDGHWAHIDATQNPYNYREMEEWDEVAIKFWREREGVQVLDLTPLWQRPDAMVGSGTVKPWNCVHTCMPGPLRLGGRVLLNLLLTELAQ